MSGAAAPVKAITAAMDERTRVRQGWGPARWQVAAAAVMAYHSPHEGRVMKRGPLPVPAGYVSMPTFAEQTGLSYGVLASTP